MKPLVTLSICLFLAACAVPLHPTATLPPAPGPTATASTTTVATAVLTRTIAPNPTATLSLTLANPLPTPTPTSFPPIIHPGWTSFTNANYIRTMLVDRNGDLWTGGSGGVVHWDVKTGRYVKYTTEHGLTELSVSAIAQAADGTMWFGTYDHGAYRFDGVHWQNIIAQDGLIDNAIYCITLAPDGTLWFASQGGVSRYDGNHWTSYTEETTGVVLADVAAISVAPDGTLWFGGYRLVHYDGQHWTETSLRPDGSGFINALAVTPDGNVWVGASNAVLFYDGKYWKNYLGPWQEYHGKPIPNRMD